MKRNLLFPVALLGLLLSGCADTAELYPGDAYVATEFVKNRYHAWDEGLKEAKVSEAKTLVNKNSDGTTKGCYFSGTDRESASTVYGYGQLASRYPNAVKNEDGSTLYWTIPNGGVTLSNGQKVVGGMDIMPGEVGQWQDQSPLIGTLYGQTKKLARVNDGFQRGYLSKLYNGQIQCDGWSSYSLVELDRSGYGTIFPAELHSAPYFAFSARGGSDTPYGTGRLSKFDITVTFYKLGENNQYLGTSFLLSKVKLETNISAEHTSLTGFYFDEVGYDPTGVVGMSMTYSLADDPATLNGNALSTTDDFDDGGPYHTALVLLEVFFPDSEWN